MSYLVPKYHFSVQWGGANMGFKEVTGLKVTREKFEYRDGLDPLLTKQKFPALKTYDDLTFKRGTYYGDNEFYEWWNEIQVNTIQKRDLIISLLDDDHNPIIVWKVRKAWPTTVESTDLNAEGNEVAIESMTITHEGLIMEHV